MSGARADESHRRAAAPYFDEAHYLRAGPELPRTGVDALDHFLLHGWLEGRNPCRTFDVAHYLAANPDVAVAGINPLVHYAWAGRNEGRQPRPVLAAEQEQLAACMPPSLRAPAWAAAADASPPVARGVLARAIGNRSKPLALSVSHDDYFVTPGGVQNVIGDEQVALTAQGWTYLHVSPAAPLPLLAADVAAEGFRIRVRIDGGSRLVTTFADLLDVVATRHGERSELIVHHLLGHVPELVARLAEAAGTRPIVWTHDHFTLCPSYTLMRNDVRFCGAPLPGSAACGVCAFGRDRRDHLPRIQAFFARTRPIVAAPSAAALDLWISRAGLPHHAAHVVPLGRLLMDDEDPLPPGDGPLRVAHLGARTMHKGWSVFEMLASRFGCGPQYRFHQLGCEDGAGTGEVIRHVPVTVTPANREAMIEAVATHRIDVVVCWPLWPETFCFVVHEAMAAGAFVVVRAAGGNVWPAVAATGQGCCVQDEAELHRLFATDELLGKVCGTKRRRGAFVPHGGAAALLSRTRVVPRPELIDA